MDVYFIRHGQTNWNLESRIQGNVDIPLNDTGIRQGKIVAEKLKHIRADLFFCSPLSRAKQTANLINEYQHLPIRIDSNITERSFGDLEGVTDLSKFSCNLSILLDTGINFSDYHIEPIKHLLERAMEFIHMLQTDYSNYHTIFVVTHVGVIQAIDYSLKHGKETSVPLLSVDNAGYLKYQL